MPTHPIEIFLQPGEHFVGTAEYRIRTVLGSCVSAVLWHPAKRVGAMSHFLLASRTSRSATSLDGRYGEDAILLMLRELQQMKVQPTECQAKIVGGGDMFPNQCEKRALNIGERNGEVARMLLKTQGIRIVSESLFGVGHRTVVFDVATGDVWVRQVKPTHCGAEWPLST